MNTRSDLELGAVSNVGKMVYISQAERQIAYEKLDKAFDWLGENVSLLGVDDGTIQTICKAETHEKVRELWGKYVVWVNQERFHREVEEVKSWSRYGEKHPWQRYTGM